MFTDITAQIATVTSVKPVSIVCPSCKVETGKKSEELIGISLIRDFYCPHCDKLVFSCRPEIKTYSYNIGSNYYD